jgi:hypothetical protein
MTVTQLTFTLTQEELAGWAAFFELRNDEEQKAMERAKYQSRSASMRSR